MPFISLSNICLLTVIAVIIAWFCSIGSILDDEIKEMLIELMDNDINMKIRQAARNALQ
jgi:hypothetical protein